MSWHHIDIDIPVNNLKEGIILRLVLGCILSPCLFNLYAGYILWNARLDEA